MPNSDNDDHGTEDRTKSDQGGLIEQNFSTDMIFIDASRGSLVGVGQMRDLAASVHLKLTHTCLIVTVTLSNPQSDPRKGAPNY